MTFHTWVGWRGSITDFIASWIQMNAGLILCSLGLTGLVKADFGMGPWGVFQIALCEQIGFSFGVSIQIVGVALLFFSYIIAKIIPSAGTIVNMYIVGIYVDYLFFPYIQYFNGFIIQFAVCLGSVVIFSIGSAVYLSADLGAGPRDSLMMAIFMRTQFSLRKVRTFLEVTVLIIGWLMGGPVGIGTVLFAFLVGPILQANLAFFPHLPFRLNRGDILNQKNGEKVTA